MASVYYPGLKNSKYYETAKKELKNFGGMISFEMNSFEEAKAVLNNVKLCVLAVSLGDCETLIQHPASNDAFHVYKGGNRSGRLFRQTYQTFCWA